MIYKQIRYLALLGLIIAVISVGSYASAGETSFDGGYGGLFTFRDDGTISASAYSLGVAYRPDIVSTVAGKTIGGKSRLLFWSNQIIRDGDRDVNFTGGGFSFGEWEGVEIIAEGSAVFTGFPGADAVTVGAYGGIRLPFTVQTQRFQFKLGGGWDGIDPLLLIILNFATK